MLNDFVPPLRQEKKAKVEIMLGQRERSSWALAKALSSPFTKTLLNC